MSLDEMHLGEVQLAEARALVGFCRPINRFPALVLHFGFGSENFAPWYEVIKSALDPFQVNVINYYNQSGSELISFVLSSIQEGNCIVADGQLRETQPLVAVFNNEGHTNLKKDYRLSDIGLYLQVHHFE